MKAALLSLSADTAIFFFFSSASDLIFLPPGLSSSTTSCSRIASARARGGTLASVRSTARLASLAIELRQRLGVVGVGHDLEPQPRGVVLQHGGELGGEPRLGAVGIADRKHQRLGIPQPDPAAPDRRDGQDQCQRSTNSRICRGCS